MKFAIDKNGDIVLIEEKEDMLGRKKIKVMGVNELDANYIDRGEYDGNKNESGSRHKS